MIPVKKLANIVQDTLGLTADFEQRYRDVQIRFVCYRNKEAVHQSPPLSSARLQTELPHLCRHYGATRVQLIITGSGHQREAIQLYNETFRLARAGHQAVTPIGHQSVAPGGYGLGNPMMQQQMMPHHMMPQHMMPHHMMPQHMMPQHMMAQHMMPAAYQGAYGNPIGFEGFGAIEMNLLLDKRLGDELLSRDFATVQKEAEELRRKIATLEGELAEQVAANAAHDKFKEYSQIAINLAPAIAPFLGGSNTILGQSLLGLGSTQGAAATGAQTEENAGEEGNEQTKMVTGMVRHFMTTLSEAHRQQLLSVMNRIRQDNSLITHIARFINSPQQPKAGVQNPLNDGEHQPQPKDV